MTDNEIIKALECCDEFQCDECPLNPYSTDPVICERRCKQESLNLINRQQAEIYKLQEIIVMGRYTSHTSIRAAESWHRTNSEYIKRLKEENERLNEKYSLAVAKYEAEVRNFTEALKTIEGEAVKVFWGELKKRNTMDERIVSVASGEKLLAELVGDKDES